MEAGPKQNTPFIFKPPEQNDAGQDAYPLATSPSAYNTVIGQLVFVVMDDEDYPSSMGMVAPATGIVSSKERSVGRTILNGISKTAKLAIAGVCQENTTHDLNSSYSLSVSITGRHKIKVVTHKDETAVRVGCRLDITHAVPSKSLSTKRKYDTEDSYGGIPPLLYIVDGDKDTGARLFDENTKDPGGLVDIDSKSPSPVNKISDCRRQVAKLVNPLISNGKYKEMGNVLFGLLIGGKLKNADALIGFLQVLQHVSKEASGTYRKRLMSMDTAAKNKDLEITII